MITRQPPQSQAIIRALLARLAELEAELDELRRQGKGATPRNSSLPPRTQRPHGKPPRKNRKKGKRRGGRPGHPKHQRALIPTDPCDGVQPLKPTECRRCGAELSGCDPDPLRRQAWELPEIKPLVTEYPRHRLACSRCGETTCAELPTNSAGERALRHAVIWRKLSFGTQSHSGSRFAETMRRIGEKTTVALPKGTVPFSSNENRDSPPLIHSPILTAIETCRQQRRKAFEYLTAVAAAHLAHQSTPSLVPGV